MFCLFLIFCTDYHLKGTLGHGVSGPMSRPVMSCGNETWMLRAGGLEGVHAGGFLEEVVGRAKLEGWGGVQGGR